MTIGEEIAAAASRQTQEIKTDADIRRVLLNAKYEAELIALQHEALSYGYSGDINQANSADLILFVELRKQGGPPAPVILPRGKTADKAEKIKIMVGAGWDDESIALSLGIGKRTVERIRTEVLKIYRRKPRK